MRNALWKKSQWSVNLVVGRGPRWGVGGEVNICNTLLCFRLARLIVESKLRLEFDLFAKQIINKFFHELTLDY